MSLACFGGNVDISVPGKFSLSVASLEVNVPNVVKITGSGIRIAYDPAGPRTQEIAPHLSGADRIPVVQRPRPDPAIQHHDSGQSVDAAHRVRGHDTHPRWRRPGERSSRASWCG
jgi:hypothetical protein